MKNLEDLKLETKDQQLGVDIVLKALRTPLHTIAKNAGADPSIVVAKVMSCENPNEGYDALKDRYVDMIHEGMEKRFADNCFCVFDLLPNQDCSPNELVLFLVFDISSVAGWEGVVCV